MCNLDWYYVISQCKQAAWMDHLLGPGWMVSRSCVGLALGLRLGARAYVEFCHAKQTSFYV